MIRWLAVVAALTLQQPGASPVRVVLDTELGRVTIDLDVARAPVTATNFLKYVQGGFYDGGFFHRTVRPGTETRTDVPIQVVQAGIDPMRTPGAFPPIPLERTSVTGLKHVDGALSMARNGPDSARSDFFVCIGEQPALDFAGTRNADGQGFAVFGRVVAGMDVIRRIQAAPVREQTQNLAPPIKILKAMVP